MTETGETHGRFVPGLGEALFQGDSERIASLLSGVQAGEIIKTWDLLLLVDNPTPEEVVLMEKSRMFTVLAPHFPNRDYT